MPKYPGNDLMPLRLSKYESCLYGYPEREAARLLKRAQDGRRLGQPLEGLLADSGVAPVPLAQQLVGDVEEGHGIGFQLVDERLGMKNKNTSRNET